MQLVGAAAAAKGDFRRCSAVAGSSLPLLLNGKILTSHSSCCMAGGAGKQAGQHVATAPGCERAANMNWPALVSALSHCGAQQSMPVSLDSEEGRRGAWPCGCGFEVWRQGGGHQEGAQQLPAHD